MQELSPFVDGPQRLAEPRGFRGLQLSAQGQSFDASPDKLHRALVIDDAPDVADSLALLLQTLGAEVQVAYGGAEGLEMLAAFHPGLVFLDLGMPGMDGFETARRLRASPDGGDVILVALTGWGQQDDRSRTQAAGFDLHLTKPASVDAMEDLLRGKRPASR